MTSAISPLPSASDLDALFRLYYRDLHGFAFSRFRNQDAAADAVQDAFLRYLQRRGGDETHNPGHFLKRIVANLAIDAGRRDRRRGHAVQIEDLAETLADPTPSAERAMIAREDYLRLTRALDALPAPVRTALLLSRVEGLTHAEIAGRLGVSASLVSKHIMTALRHCLARM